MVIPLPEKARRVASLHVRSAICAFSYNMRPHGAVMHPEQVLSTIRHHFFSAVLR